MSNFFPKFDENILLLLLTTTYKKTLNDEEYHEKIERKLNDTIAKIERGELNISDLSKADQNFVTKMMESKRK